MMATTNGKAAEPVVFFDRVLEVPEYQDRPLLAFPREHTVADFELFTGKDLNLLVNRATKHYHHGLELKSDQPNTIITLIGPSSLDYTVTMFALSRLGFGVLFLSTRLTPEACLKLMKDSKSQIVVQSASNLGFNLGHRVQKLDDTIKVYAMASGTQYRSSDLDRSPALPAYSLQRSDDLHRQDTAVIFHSSGSTGFPKALAISHEKHLVPWPFPQVDNRVLTVSPLFHAYANRLGLSAMVSGRCTYHANVEVPQTSSGLLEMLEAAKPHLFAAVPYNLKLTAEVPGGIEALARCMQVVSSGSALSDALGDRLVKGGVNIGSMFAGTENGVIGTSFGRAAGDNSWDYIRIFPHVLPHIQFKPVAEDVFEFVFLKSTPSLVVSNSNDPPGSFHSSDCFTPHPIIKNAFKFVYRVDDRITLDNGEKVLPLPIEGRIKEDHLVKEAVMFGIGRSAPGLFLFRSESSSTMSAQEYVDRVWPSIEAANRDAEAFSKISKDMVVVLPPDVKLPAADKGSVMRSRVYQEFEAEIEQAYGRLHSGPRGAPKQQLKLGQQELEAWLLKKCKVDFEMGLDGTTTQLYSAGLDSLRATQLRALILNNIAIGKGSAADFTVSKVFEAGTIQRLAAMIVASRTEQSLSNGYGEDELKMMEELVNKYSSFDHHKADGTRQTERKTILLTGATGSLGAHLLSQLNKRKDVDTIVCFVRGTNPKERLEGSLQSRQLSTTLEKVTIFASDLAEPQLGLDDSTYLQLQKEVTHIVHAAWPVNFQLGLSAFEPQLIGLKNLLDFSLMTSRSTPARLLFCSSVSTAMATPAPTTIKESVISDFTHALPQGYARSKLVSEHIIQVATRAGADAHILRIGQIIGDTDSGVWKSTEAFPLTIQSALTLRVLPKLDVTCSWIPVDTVAGTIIDLLIPKPDTHSNSLVWNLQNPKTFHWTRDLLPILKKQGLKFDEVEVNTWLEQLRYYSEQTPSAETLRLNPAVKLTDFYEKTYGHELEKRNNGTNTSRHRKTARHEVSFDTTLAERDSLYLRNSPDVLETGLMGKIVQHWLETWPSA